MKKPTTDHTERFKASDENMRQMASRIAEMEAAGLKVVRRDDMYCRAVLITPEIVHAATEGMHGYYPDAVAEVYDAWKSQRPEEATQ